VSEGREQRDFVKWFRETWPEYGHCLRVSLTGLNFGSGPRAGRMMNYIRSMGIEMGESDLLIALPRGDYHALVIEHKKAGGSHNVSSKQRAYLDRHTATGALAVSTRGLGALQAVTEAYINLGE
jgi:hypothetical protein